MQITEVVKQTKSMVDDLKAICFNSRLGGSPSEYKIITNVFLYKFFNDKFIYEIQRVNDKFQSMSVSQVEDSLKKMSDDDYEMLLLDLGASTAKLKKEHFISSLFNKRNETEFHKIFDEALIDIANFNFEIFSVQAGGDTKIRLFDPISQYILEPERKDPFCRAVIDKIAMCSFNDVFHQKYDFFATIFEYLIKDYNKDFGQYAEYYTPHTIASIIAKIMVTEKTSDVTVYDPAAGTGTLVLALAHEIGESNCSIYTQDISQKSNEFLRLNLILNNLVHSLPHVINDDTLVNPRHLNENKNAIRTFDYLVSNPPFNMDFSETRSILSGEKHQKRFFAGAPNIPNKDKKSMSIYLMFLQHIIYSMNEKSKAAIVVPTGFLTAGSGIQKSIRERIVEERMLRGVISMPSNIFATTGTNVSIIFLDRENKDGKVVLMDASRLGSKVKEDGKNQKTVLSDEEIIKIIDTFNNAVQTDEFCVVVDYGEIEAKKLSFSAGQYFDIKIEYNELSAEEFQQKINGFKDKLNVLFAENKSLEKDILKHMERLFNG
jgi:type I restriction enzyme M protein